MRRTLFDSPFLKKRRPSDNCSLRVRDEGDKITVTFKWFESNCVDGAREIETEVGSFDSMLELFKATGFKEKSFQESRRETWELNSCKVELDAWPWLLPLVEIEGESEESVRSCSAALGFDWGKAVFGDVMAAYRRQYPNLPVDFSIAQLSEVRFGQPLPKPFRS